jgi:hypothetical protein
MESAEIYFRLSAQIRDRELFLEKAMLDSEVHHLEVRTGFYDKLALLAAGSLAVGVSFLVSGFQNNSLKCGVQQFLLYIGLAMALILLSLILCVIHNSAISSAVTLLSKEVEYTYLAASEQAKMTTLNNSFSDLHNPPPAIKAKIKDHEGKATDYGAKKERTVRVSKYLGWATMAMFILGYVVGILSVFAIFIWS